MSQVAQTLEAGEAADIEDIGQPPRPLQPAILISTKRKRISQGEDSQVESQELELTQSWREILGPPPPKGQSKVSGTPTHLVRRVAMLLATFGSDAYGEDISVWKFAHFLWIILYLKISGPCSYDGKLF